MGGVTQDRVGVLGIIPARGGSKGIPRKNLVPVLGKPLIAWTIEAGQAANRIDRLVVSTEDPEIAATARSLNCEVVDRPETLATDGADTLDVIQHVLKEIPAESVVLLQPTSPVRDDGLIDECIRRFEVSSCDSLATGLDCKWIEYGKNDLNRQDIEGFFYDDGNVYVIRADMLLKGDRYGTHREHVLLDREQNIDVDDAFDLWLAEQVLRRRGKGRTG